MSFRLLIAAAVLALLCSPSRSQTLGVRDFVSGQVATLEVSGAPAGSTVVWLYSLAGVGAGTCIAGTPVCLGILEPVTIAEIGVAAADGTARYAVFIPSSLPLIDVHLQAVIVDYASGVDVSETNALTATIEPLSAFDDDFAGPGLASDWQILNPAAAQVSVSQGQLVIDPVQSGPSATWFNDGEGVMVYRPITGDFTVTATVSVEDPLNGLLPPPPAYRLGGLIVRDPAGGPGTRNSAHVAFGSGPASNPVGVEHKTTLGSSSSFVILPTAETAGQLRISRTGDLIELSYREASANTFVLIATYPHPELPPTIEVGMMAYSFSSPATIRARFDDIAFTAP